jgi:hypothetical protein
MTTLDNINRFVTRVRGMEGKQIHSLTSNERKLARYLRSEGLM